MVGSYAEETAVWVETFFLVGLLSVSEGENCGRGVLKRCWVEICVGLCSEKWLGKTKVVVAS